MRMEQSRPRLSEMSWKRRRRRGRRRSRRGQGKREGMEMIEGSGSC